MVVQPAPTQGLIPPAPAKDPYYWIDSLSGIYERMLPHTQ